MSYSRIVSRSQDWCTYWKKQGPAIETRDSAIFVVGSLWEFTAKGLRDNLDGLLKNVEKHGDIEELKIYVAEFLADVDKEYRFCFENGAFDPVTVEKYGELFEFSACGLFTDKLPLKSLVYNQRAESGIVELVCHGGTFFIWIDCSSEEFERFREWVG